MASVRQRGLKFTGLYRDASGAQRSAGSFGTEADALKAAQHAEALAKPPKAAEIVHPAVKKGRPTVAASLPRWIDGQLLEETSRETYRRTGDRILRHLGGMPREDVTPDDVRKMIKALKKDGLRDATVSATLDLARSFLGEEACSGVRFRIKDRREMRIATQEQAKAIEDAMSPRYKLLVRVAFTTGCRWGEMIALRGTDVEGRGTGFVLKVRRTVIEVDGERSERAYGKSQRAARDITLPEALAVELAAYGSALCFTNARGGYLRRNAFRSGFWLPATRKAGIQGLRVHDCRHSAISWWANAGIQMAAVRDRAGHSNISVTSRYVHTMPGDADPFMTVLGEAA